MKLKKLMPLLILAMMVSLVSCKKSPEKLIARTWKVTNVVSKGTYNDSIFQALKADLMKVEMTFKDNKYTMTSDGNVIETGTYTCENDKLVVQTEGGMNMDAIVTKENLTLDTPDFMTTLIPQ
ncbi:MAG: hypothetical protein JW723_14980 [Bacteroidales bacterium]|nr:hypothetical protein [Bacteroidales bacterium]